MVQVGETQADHDCWERPEDMDTPRTAFALDAPDPASDLAGEIAAALAAASIAFKQSRPKYSEVLLDKAIKTFQYADSHRGRYTDNPDVNKAVCPFYCSVNGYKVYLGSFLNIIVMTIIFNSSTLGFSFI